MLLNWDLTLNLLVIGSGSTQALTNQAFRLDTIEPMQLRCSRAGVPDQLPAGSVLTYGIKPTGEYQANHLAKVTDTDWIGPQEGDLLFTYTAGLDLGGDALIALLSPDAEGSAAVEQDSLTLMGFMSAQVPGEARPRSTQKLTVTVFNNGNKGDEPPVDGSANGIYPPAAAVTAAIAAVAAAAPLASPALTGTPSAPTAAPGTNTAQLATTAFVQAASIDLGNPPPIGNEVPNTGAFTAIVGSGLTISGAFSLDGGNATSDGYGNWSLAEGLTTGYVNAGTATTQTFNAGMYGQFQIDEGGDIVSGGAISTDSGGLYTDGGGNAYAQSFNSENINVSGSFVAYNAEVDYTLAVYGTMLVPYLPNSDPENPGQLYQVGGVVMVSL